METYDWWISTVEVMGEQQYGFGGEGVNTISREVGIHRPIVRALEMGSHSESGIRATPR